MFGQALGEYEDSRPGYELGCVSIHYMVAKTGSTDLSHWS